MQEHSRKLGPAQGIREMNRDLDELRVAKSFDLYMNIDYIIHTYIYIYNLLIFQPLMNHMSMSDVSCSI